MKSPEEEEMNRSLFSFLFGMICSLAVSGATAAESARPVCLIRTSMGDIHVELFADETPETVKNFIDLAEGKREFKDPGTGQMVKRPFYDNLIFHRVIKNFMIQGGCPLGTGTGGPGYRFEDEINSGERPSHHPLRGVIAMANSGPNTNGSQFFINLVDTPWLAGKHTVFGRVVEGMAVVDKIGSVAVGNGSRPKKDVVILSIRKLETDQNNK